MITLRTSELLTWDRYELGGALKEAGQIVEDFCAEVACPLGHHRDEAILNMFLISFDFVDNLGGILLLDLGR